MSTTVRSLLDEHPRYYTDSRKKWQDKYPAITKFHIQTQVQNNGCVTANFNPFLPLQEDDELRLSELAYPPNCRSWRLASEADAGNWFHHEVSNVVIAAWAKYPNVLQTAEAPALTETKVDETVDILYSTYHANNTLRLQVAAGEWKRNTINARESASQQRLSQELKGYADKYECPHIFCFDGSTLLMLQFRANDKGKIKDAKCEVDCWVIPRENGGGCTVRYGLYRLLVQGFRKCQGLRSYEVSLGGIRPSFRQFYSGRPVWKVDGQNFGNHPQDGGNRVWDTPSFWDTAQLEQEGGQEGHDLVEEDIYNA
ncbi:hypothetical protein QBC46DRAFT_365378 [Diplogelasinospora grovesii]|uniref:Uncharacterized protein n=1 Tax=Diplogelasinospora grovesii TaxID=303347 RepID=A0AAN6N4D5_9PEZI|nr:hypothetical protein QBC46DRAFT_365378 [Diplogelasinospora grovesii]